MRALGRCSIRLQLRASKTYPLPLITGKFASMSAPRRATAFLSRLLRGRASSESGETGEPPVDTAEELQKIHRGLRRLSLAADRNAALLEAVGVRVDGIQQTLLKTSQPQQSAVSLDEAQLLRILDQLDRLAAVPGLPPAAGTWIDDVRSVLLERADWTAVALPGAAPDGVDIRITEVVDRTGDANDLGDAPGKDDAGAAGGAGGAAGRIDGNRRAQAVIHRVLEQGYRRADGTLLRPAVVVAATHRPDSSPLESTMRSNDADRSLGN